MVKINQIGVGRKSSGTIDGITYYSVNGKTFARSLPQMPASVFNTPKAKKRQAIFKFVQQHMKLHLNTIKQTFASDNKERANNRYYRATVRHSHKLSDLWPIAIWQVRLSPSMM